MPLHYAVLASVSGRYSPLEGRLLTCYSPVRHSMHSPKRALIVRLACLRHAASVDSEPGSNSRSFPSSSFEMPIITYRTFCCSYELTHGHAYLVFKYQLLFASLPVRGETIDYTEAILYVKQWAKVFNFFFRTRRTGMLRAIYDSLRLPLDCQATFANL